METSLVVRRRASIKKRLLDRFGKAREIVGPGWRSELARSDPFFNTREGEAYMRSVAQAYSDDKRGHVDRIECVTLALEKVAGIEEEDCSFNLHFLLFDLEIGGIVVPILRLAPALQKKPPFLGGGFLACI